MKFRLKLIPAIALVVALVFSMVPQETAKAVSDYDEIVQSPAYWKVEDSLGHSYDVDIQEAIDNVSNSTAKANCQALYAKLSQMAYRSFDLLQPSRYSVANHARVFASDSLPSTTVWSSEGPTKRAHAPWDDIVMISFSYDEANDKVIADGCGDAAGTSVDVTFAMRWNDGFITESTYLTEGFHVDYPSGYAGDPIPSANRTGLIQGGVTCANSNNVITNVWINANSGLSGSAKLTDDGNGGKNYRYYLTEESPYHLSVICDGDLFTGPTVLTDYYYNYQWVCTFTTPGQNPNLGICAAS